MTIDLEKQERTITSTPLAAGTYLVGDPCYAFDNDLDHNWQNWLEDAWKDTDPNKVRILDGRVDGMRVVAAGTEYGDGAYGGSDGNEYGVDAGLLGAVHIDFLRNLYPEYSSMSRDEVEAASMMFVVEFPEPFHVSYEDGTISIGHIDIYTGDMSVDEEDLCPNCGGDDCYEDCLEADDEEQE